MTNLEKLKLKEERLSKLINNPKNLKSGGTIRKLKRQIRNMEMEA